MHVRGQIRAYLAAKLRAIAALQDRVSTTRREIPDASELPWAFLTIGNENVSVATTGSVRKLERELTFTVDLLGRDADDAVGQVEEIAAAVETTLAADPTMGRLALSCDLVAYTVERIGEDTSQPVVRLQMQFLVFYLTAADAPAVAL